MHELQFLPRDAMRKRGLCCGPVSVRLSVRLSVMLVHSIQTAEAIVKLLCRPIARHSSFLTPGADTRLQGKPFQRGRKIQGWENFAIFD